MKKMILTALFLLIAAAFLFSEDKLLMDLTVNFGYDGKPYDLHLYDNDTAVAIARHVGSRDWQLPIVGFDGFDNSDVMHYYDVPSRYIIPSKTERITSEKAGEVYYSHPNRLVLFFHDANVPADYVKIGYFDATGDFIRAVEENPVLDYWNCMILKVKR